MKPLLRISNAKKLKKKKLKEKLPVFFYTWLVQVGSQKII